MKTFSWLLVILLSLPAIQTSAQDESREQEIEYATNTYLDIRVINAQSVMLTPGGILKFNISHRFGQLNEGAYEFWGLDRSTIRLSLNYGVTDWLDVGIARSTYEKTFEANAKAKILYQSTGKKEVPVSMAWYSSAFLRTLKWRNQDRNNLFSNRLSYAHQLVVARKFSDRFSLELVPTLIHYNLVELEEHDNNRYSMGIGAKYNISESVTINTEYFYRFNGLDQYHNLFSVGFDILTGGHVFQLHFTNSRGMFERAFIEETSGDWTDGGIYFGFNITRMFYRL
ncbi:MAG TPA: DUF5777 family beta-barrel protein [Bacteroidales bacterium]|nr:DUF5777 family beta-barrel protein [Bacteroidales bacterium]